MSSGGRFFSVTTFKRDGTGVATPLWCVSDDGHVYALTDRGSAKVRRIRHNPNVLLAPCRPDGKLRGEPVAARAEVMTATSELDRVQHLLLQRFPVSYRAVMLAYRIGRLARRQQSVADGAALSITPANPTRRSA